MTTDAQRHIINRLHAMITSTVMGDLNFKAVRIVDTNAVGLAIAAKAMVGVNEWDQPIEYPVTILVIPDLPAQEP